MKRLWRKSPLLFASSAALLTLWSAVSRANSFYIEESVVYSAPGTPVGMFCGGTNLNEITPELVTELNGDGRSGQRYSGASAWPQSFREACNASYGSGGLDSSWGDTARLTAFAGHGCKARITHGQSHNGACTNLLGTNVRLGLMAGGTAEFAIFATSCTLNEAYLSRFLQSQLRQGLGFSNSPAIADDDLGDFYSTTNPKSNKLAWMDELDDKPGWFQGSNTPMIVSKALSNAAAISTNDSFYFRGSFWEPMGGASTACLANQPSYYWYYAYRNAPECPSCPDY